VPRASRSSSIHVHHRGERGVDGILRLIELAGHDGAAEAVLTAMCVEIAAIAGADVASVYVREGAGASDDDDALVMRGNHGFPADAVGTVVLRVGEGITGLVAECMRPVSAAHAQSQASYKHVPGLGEERFPVFAGVPLIGGGRVIGVLVLQRRSSRAFSPAEIALVTALGAPVTLALERRRAQAVRSARLVGTPLVGGLVLGRAGAVPTSTALPAPGDLTRAAHRLRDDLERAGKKLARVDHPAIGGALDRMTLALLDQRLRERLAEAAGRPAGLREVARDYARAPYRTGAEPTTDAGARAPATAKPEPPYDDGARATSVARAAEIEDLCVLLGLATDATSPLRPGGVWIADRIGTFVAIAAVGRGAGALVAASSAVTPAATAIAHAARLPVVADVHGVFGWARPGDLIAVDADHGEVLVNPAPADIERVRRRRLDDDATLPGR
jgi:phosphotransferase system enzyme I (PtsP)